MRLVNIQKKYAAGKMNKNDVTYIDPDHTWTTSGGTFSTNLYYKDNLHLVEKGNEKLVKAITTPFNVGALKQQQNLPQIGQLNQQKRPQHHITTTTNKNKSSNIKKCSKNIKENNQNQNINKIK